MIAANRGDRLERFQLSTDLARCDAARRRVWPTRYMRSGHGDRVRFRELDRQQGARHDGPGRRRVHHEVAGLDTVGERAVRRENTSLLIQMIAGP
ncbi:hypothetical protein [Nonomuraea sp. NPDC049624]|uniref:hypothetical protein n=1 Tax=Nonomuraea sp. NPDC049624 TaxID=3154354 RepID=UPI00342DC769